jgi:hypothetical protein
MLHLLYRTNPEYCYVCYQSLGVVVGKVKNAGAARSGGQKSKRRVKTSKSAKPARRKPAKRTKPAKKRKPAPSAASAPRFTAKALDPVRKCGTGTSVQHLYRVDEASGNTVRPHLVFFDRHGWYCEHGRDCPAVAFAEKLARKAAGKFGVRARHTGPTHNGRMRA